jgi:hypothetical protein
MILILGFRILQAAAVRLLFVLIVAANLVLG